MTKIIRDKILAFSAVLMMVFVTMTQMVGNVELEDGPEAYRFTSSDTGSPIQYTSSHTTVLVGPSDRTAILEMPGGHDYSRPLPLVVALHGFSNSGQEVTYNMGLTDSIHDNEHYYSGPMGHSILGLGIQDSGMRRMRAATKDCFGVRHILMMSIG